MAEKTRSEMNRIKEVLEQKGIKQTWLAEKLGKSYNMVNAYAQNRQQPRLETLMEIAEILDIDVKELIISNKENLINFSLNVPPVIFYTIYHHTQLLLFQSSN